MDVPEAGEAELPILIPPLLLTCFMTLRKPLNYLRFIFLICQMRKISSVTSKIYSRFFFVFFLKCQARFFENYCVKWGQMRMLVGWCWRHLKICFHRLKILCVLSLDQDLLTVRFSGLWNVTKVIIVVSLKHDKWPLRLNSFMKKKNLPWQQHWDLITGSRPGGKNRDSHWLLSRERRQEPELKGKKEDRVR